ncbi:ATP-binding cassette sub- D member 2 [Coemansia sp. Benny D115]|nr:ATP-binding cassette sub- D member 2 [Coemansia sp. Benny D115]
MIEGTAGDEGAGYLGIRVLTAGPTKGSAKETNVAEQSGGRWEETAEVVEFVDAHIRYRGRRQLAITGLTMLVERGHHCLVVGAGQAQQRAALIRVLQDPGGDLLQSGVQRGPRMTVVTARPYVRAGSCSLWELLVFPHDKRRSAQAGVGERELSALLHFMGFEFLLQRASDDWGRAVDWLKVLGPGELFAVAVCRLLYHAPPFGLVDEALSCLRTDQVSKLFEAARRHRVSLVVMAESDPFDERAKLPPVSEAADSGEAHLHCLSEFTRVLRLAPGSWAFCSSGYTTKQRPAFEHPGSPGQAPQWVWAVEGSDWDATGRLQRRTSALSQCSTTERRWLATPEPETLASRRHSRVTSPPLTARSSFSDLGTEQLQASAPRVLKRSSLLGARLFSPVVQEHIVKAENEPIAKMISESAVKIISEPAVKKMSEPVIKDTREPVTADNQATLVAAPPTIIKTTSAPVEKLPKEESPKEEPLSTELPLEKLLVVPEPVEEWSARSSPISTTSNKEEATLSPVLTEALSASSNDTVAARVEATPPGVRSYRRSSRAGMLGNPLRRGSVASSHTSDYRTLTPTSKVDAEHTERSLTASLAALSVDSASSSRSGSTSSSTSQGHRKYARDRSATGLHSPSRIPRPPSFMMSRASRASTVSYDEASG